MVNVFGLRWIARENALIQGIVFSTTLNFFQRKKHAQAVACWNTNFVARGLSIFPTACFCYVFLARRIVLRAWVENGLREKGCPVPTLDTENCSSFSSPELKKKSFLSFNTWDTRRKTDDSLKKKSFQRTDLGSFQYLKFLRGVQGATTSDTAHPAPLHFYLPGINTVITVI